MDRWTSSRTCSLPVSRQPIGHIPADLPTLHQWLLRTTPSAHLDPSQRYFPDLASVSLFSPAPCPSVRTHLAAGSISRTCAGGLFTGFSNGRWCLQTGMIGPDSTADCLLRV